jgi:hypothetical protein
MSTSFCLGKFLKSSCATRLSFEGWQLIVNQVLVSTLWLCTSIWRGYKQMIQKKKMLLHNKSWSRKDHNVSSQVNWKDYCSKKKIKGLGLIDP